MTLLRGLRASIDMLNAEGLENVFKRHNHLASGVRAAVTAWGLKNCAVDSKWHSDTVTAIRVPQDIDANDVIKTAYYKYGVSLGAGLGPLNGNVFRIGHLGWLNETMVLQHWAALRWPCVMPASASCQVAASERPSKNIQIQKHRWSSLRNSYTSSPYRAPCQLLLVGGLFILCHKNAKLFWQ